MTKIRDFLKFISLCSIVTSSVFFPRSSDASSVFDKYPGYCVGLASELMKQPTFPPSPNPLGDRGPLGQIVGTKIIQVENRNMIPICTALNDYSVKTLGERAWDIQRFWSNYTILIGTQSVNSGLQLVQFPTDESCSLPDVENSYLDAIELLKERWIQFVSLTELDLSRNYPESEWLFFVKRLDWSSEAQLIDSFLKDFEEQYSEHEIRSTDVQRADASWFRLMTDVRKDQMYLLIKRDSLLKFNRTFNFKLKFNNEKDSKFFEDLKDIDQVESLKLLEDFKELQEFRDSKLDPASPAYQYASDILRVQVERAKFRQLDSEKRALEANTEVGEFLGKLEIKQTQCTACMEEYQVGDEVVITDCNCRTSYCSSCMNEWKDLLSQELQADYIVRIVKCPICRKSWRLSSQSLGSESDAKLPFEKSRFTIDRSINLEQKDKEIETDDNERIAPNTGPNHSK